MPLCGLHERGEARHFAQELCARLAQLANVSRAERERGCFGFNLACLRHDLPPSDETSKRHVAEFIVVEIIAIVRRRCTRVVRLRLDACRVRQAQSDVMSLIADKDLMIGSVNGTVRIVAKKEMTLESGGAFIQFKDGSITLGGPGDLFLKTITVQKKGKESIRIPLPALPIAPDQHLFSNLVDLSDAGFATSNTDHAWANLTYLVADKAGNNLASGTLDDAATGSRIFTREPKDVDVWIGTPGWEPTEETRVDDDSEKENA